MSATSTFLRSAVLLGASAGLWAGNFDSLIQDASQRFSKHREAMVVCNLEANKAVVAELAAAAKAQNIELRAVNVASPKDIDQAYSILQGQRPDFVVVVDTDSVLGGQARATKTFIRTVKNMGIPTVATGSEALKVGAVLSPTGKTQG